jgi:hypothetical protein
MSKHPPSSKIAAKKSHRETPVIVYFSAFGIGLLGYAVGRIALSAFPHPIHWASGIAGAFLGYFAGWAWYRWRGDII